KHNDLSPGGLLHWWDSADIRISVPGSGVESDAWIEDPVSVESCPVEAAYCPNGTIPDEYPIRGQRAKVYVQVHNRGNRAATNVRVLAIWTPADAGVPLLPDGFWTTTLPANATACGGWPGPTNWHFFDNTNCTSSFQTTTEIGADQTHLFT